MATIPRTIRIPAETEAWLRARAARMPSGPGSISGRFIAELQLWRSAMQAELGQLDFTIGELGVIAGTCNSLVIAETAGGTPGQVARGVAEAVALSPGMWGRQWEIDEDGLVAKLSELGPTADAALADAVARWWAEGHQNTAEGWAAVGIAAT